ILRWTFLIWLLVTIGLVAANWSLVTQIARFSPLILPPMYGEAETPAEAQLQDIRFLRKLTSYDRSFSAEELAAFTAHMDAMATHNGGMSDAEFYLGVMRAAAISGNGHTNASKTPAYTQFNNVGVKLYWFADGLYVVRAVNKFADLVGARIISIEGTPVEAVNTALDKYMGGAAQWRRVNNTFLIESPELMHAAGLAASPDILSVTVADADGAERSVSLPARAAPQGDLPRRRPWMSLRADALADEGDAWWRSLSLEGDAAPLYLRDPANNFFTSAFDGGFYMRPQLLLQRKETPIHDQLAGVIEAAPADGYEFLIADLRWSPGGDYTQVIDFVKAAPRAIKDGGKLYIVTSPNTFSAALVTAAFLKYYGGEKSMIIGEPMGDIGQFWAETGFPFELPNSGYYVNYATGYHDWENGCAGKHEFCFSQNLKHEVPAGSLLPEITVSPTYANYASGRDVVMERIVADIKGEEVALTGYAETAAAINATMRKYHYNPEELESDEYRAIETAIIALAASAADDDAFLTGFRDIWRDGPFSHVRLDKAQGTADELAEYLDNLRIGGGGAMLTWQGETAILTVNTMMGLDTIEEIDAAYDEIAGKGADKLIIDLRENGGGAFAVLPLVSHVLAEPMDAGGFISQPWNASHDAPPTAADIAAVEPWNGWSVRSFWDAAQTRPLTRIRFEPKAPVFEGNVFVLTSAKTESAAEMAADALKASGRATLIGETTAGKMLSQKLYDVPGGFHLSLPIADYYSAAHGRIEGAGVAPDIAVAAEAAMDAALAR
ncbi:S41 family peptidase, partial [Hyphococcus sp.]|uniref:S41 family peptidase n=1 Tax=Hyphococcus sp. TaxID=2038636 RepID=UPI003752E34B